MGNIKFEPAHAVKFQDPGLDGASIHGNAGSSFQSALFLKRVAGAEAVTRVMQIANGQQPNAGPLILTGIE